MNQPTPTTTLSQLLAQTLRAQRHEIAAHWLERIVARVALDANEVFPSEQLLDHIPVLIEGIADFIEDPAEAPAADVPIVGRAVELGTLRFEQGFDASEILKEYEILGGILYRISQDVLAERPAETGSVEAIRCAQRIFRGVSAVCQITTSHYLRMLAERVGEREERLRRFNRMLTHELKNRVGAVLGAGQLLQEEWLEAADRAKFSGMVTENAQAIQKVLENLIVLSRLDGDRRRQRNVGLPDVVREVLRQLRELARARGVSVRIVEALPEVEVNAAAVELCLSNYISNAIKYADLNRPERWVEVLATVQPGEESAGEAELLVRVRDNGLGVPPEQRNRLFERFFRGHERLAEGTGLGLSLVQETAESFGGRAWAEFDSDEGSTFAFTLPCRRLADRGALQEISGPA